MSQDSQDSVTVHLVDSLGDEEECTVVTFPFVPLHMNSRLFRTVGRVKDLVRMGLKDVKNIEMVVPGPDGGGLNDGVVFPNMGMLVIQRTMDISIKSEVVQEHTMCFSLRSKEQSRLTYSKIAKVVSKKIEAGWEWGKYINQEYSIKILQENGQEISKDSSEWEKKAPVQNYIAWVS